MPKRHEKGRRVAEPVQVYLAHDERQTLKRLAEQLSLSMSDVVRRAIATLEESVMHPEKHPALRLVGMVDRETVPAPPYDPAVEHDRYLADVTDPPAPRATTKRTRRGR